MDKKPMRKTDAKTINDQEIERLLPVKSLPIQLQP